MAKGWNHRTVAQTLKIENKNKNSIYICVSISQADGKHMCRNLD